MSAADLEAIRAAAARASEVDRSEAAQIDALEARLGR
jgi:hypothetical protein